MRRIEKNTDKIKGAFLQSLSCVGNVNTFQKSWQGGIATQISLGVTDCFSLITRSLECPPHLHRLGFGLLLTEDITWPWEIITIFSFSLSSFCFQGSRWGGNKRDWVPERPSAPLNALKGKPCAGTLFKERRVWEISKFQLSAFSYLCFICYASVWRESRSQFLLAVPSSGYFLLAQ